MKTAIKIFRDEIGKICGAATQAENGEEMFDDNLEYLEFIKTFENPAPTWDTVRQKRDELIKSSDWIFLPDVTLKNKESWLTYRQALRDLPQNFEDPSEVIWPQKPE